MQSTNIKLQKPDFTAWFVLQGAIAAMRRPEFYNDKNEPALKLYKILALEAGNTRLMSRIIHQLPYGWQYKIGEFVTNKGRLRHFYLRKKEIEKQTRNLLAREDIQQIIVLGAGLDVLALRLSREYPTIKFIEIDRAESQAFKLSSLTKHNIKIPENMELLAGDLRDPLAGILASSKLHDKTAKTLWIAEGLLMFIPPESVTGLFNQIKENSKSGSYCIFTSLDSKDQGTALSKVIQKLYMKKEKCPLQWSMPYPEIPNFMQKLGFLVTEQINCGLLHKDYINKKSDINHKIGDDIHIVKMIG